MGDFIHDYESWGHREAFWEMEMGKVGIGSEKVIYIIMWEIKHVLGALGFLG